jgi:hypothetical protein
MTPADELRHVAKLLREVAEGATPGPWKHMCLGSEGCLVLRDSGTIRERGRGRVARFGQKDWKADHADAQYVAIMHPGVAESLALLLDERAHEYDEMASGPYGAAGAAFVAGAGGGDLDPALAIARALDPASVTEEHR